MNLHEYQAKQLFKDYGLPVSEGIACQSAEAVGAAIDKIAGSVHVVKTQVHAGGRGKAGGVKLVKSKAEAVEFAESWLGKHLVTYQTDSNGQLVNTILVEYCTDIATELYLSLLIDRSQQKIVLLASTEGGVDIETVAEEQPEKIHTVAIDPHLGISGFQIRYLATALQLDKTQSKQLNHLLTNLVKLFIEKDLALVEINPLVITTEGNIHCLDAKVSVDSNALYRQKQVQTMRDYSQEDSREAEADEWQLNYVALEGSIGCMVNGAGLAMGTMDTIKLQGGSPANFLDVGGGATKERVAKALQIILSDTSVKAILVNIFGGIVRCDMIAEGILAAIAKVAVTVPVIIRLEGTNAELGLDILNKSNLNIKTSNSLSEAAKLAVENAK